MVKLFFVGVGIFILVVVGAFAAVFTPLLAGVNRNLGGNPRMPFHSPIPQPIVDVVHGWATQATPSVLLTGVAGILALVLVYTVGTMIAQLRRRWTEHRRRVAELRWRARVAAAREQSPASEEAKAEYEAIWE